METELLGIPSTVLTTRPFVSQARAMSRMRGDPEYRVAVIEHPIVTLTDAELSDRAAIAAPQVIACLLEVTDCQLRGSADYSAYCGGAAKHEFPKQPLPSPQT